MHDFLITEVLFCSVICSLLMLNFKDICGKTVDSSEELEKLRKELEVCKDVHEKV